MNIKRALSLLLLLFVAMSQGEVSSQVMSDYLAVPPYISESAPPMVMFVMSKDHKSFYKAYNDVSDIDEDGTIDSTYKDGIHYYGYFDSNKCYNYQSNRFEPVGTVNSPGSNHYCSGRWSGNFLNWATMARIDIIRKVLYGGYRSEDTTSRTVLSRTTLPRDAHSWAKVYDGADISSLIPFSWNSITLCNTNTSETETSSLIYVKNGLYPYTASTEGKQCRKQYQGGSNLSPNYTYNADVLVCNDATGEDCETYVQGASSPRYKPVGLLQEFGVNRNGTPDTTDDTANMHFGLITGSYRSNVSGGVLRSNISDVPVNEIATDTGIVLGTSKIIKNINSFRVSQYNYNTGWYDKGGSEGRCVPGEPTILSNGTCTSWGNPIGEMLYETIRYFKGTKACTSQYKTNNPDTGINGLSVENSWDDPYQNFPTCSKPFALILSDSYPSYDSDDLPGANWGSFSGSDTPNVTTLVDDSDMNSIESINTVIVGESGGTNDRKCTEKSGSNFKSIRGLCVEEPTKQGAYYTPALAWHARTTDLNTVEGEQYMHTYAVATGSPLPTIDLRANGNTAYLIPAFHDGCPDTSYPGCGSPGAGGDDSKGELVDFQICQNDADWSAEQLNGYENCYDILWDDAEYGWDYELDIRYRIYTKINGNIVTVKTKGLYAAAGHLDYAGYYITGVDNPGEYLDIKCGGGAGFSDCDSYTGNETPVVERSFSITGSSASILKGPLWYAAKYGGFKDDNNNDVPDLQKEWDKNNDGTPDTYFNASNPLNLKKQLTKALLSISAQASSGTSVSVLATTGDGDGAVYQAYYYPEKVDEDSGNARSWLGNLRSFFVDRYGNLREDTLKNETLDLSDDMIIEMSYDPLDGTQVNKYVDSNGDGVKDSATPAVITDIDNIKSIWEAGEKLWSRDASSRLIYTSTNGSTTQLFTSGAAATLKPYLRAADDAEAADIIDWVRGEDLAGYRSRTLKLDSGPAKVWKLGDIVHSTPTNVGRPMENYDLLYNDSSYTTYRKTHINRKQVVYVGANDGMLHAFNAGCFDQETYTFHEDVDGNSCKGGSDGLGEELWAFIPRGLLPHLKWLTDTDYSHVYYVDLKPKITDVKIFDADADHPGGWGTILIGGFRLGGKDISWNSGGTGYDASPEYFALDITVPETPRLLWTFKDPQLGLSMSFPSVARVDDTWFVTFGSGAKNYDIYSNFTTLQKGRVFVLQISGAGATNGVISDWTEDVTDGSKGHFWKRDTPSTSLTAYLSDPISVDVDIDNDVDVLYIAENIKTGASWNSLMHRVTTDQSSTVDPDWIISTLGNVNTIAGIKDNVKIISSAPAAAMDDRANLWVYFGTGQYIGSFDKNQTATGGFYAIKDGCWKGDCSTTFSDFLDVSKAVVKTDGSVTDVQGTCAAGIDTWPKLLKASNSVDCEGWAMYFSDVVEDKDFQDTTIFLNHSGERLVSKPLVLGGIVSWATFIPGLDECATEGESNAYAVYYKTGTATPGYIFENQKNQANPTDEVARIGYLGKGMPSSPSAQVTSDGSTKVFFQQSTGAILTSKNSNPVTLKSGLSGWTNKPIQ